MGHVNHTFWITTTSHSWKGPCKTQCRGPCNRTLHTFSASYSVKGHFLPLEIMHFLTLGMKLIYILKEWKKKLRKKRERDRQDLAEKEIFRIPTCSFIYAACLNNAFHIATKQKKIYQRMRGSSLIRECDSIVFQNDVYMSGLSNATKNQNAIQG